MKKYSLKYRVFKGSIVAVAMLGLLWIVGRTLTDAADPTASHFEKETLLPAGTKLDNGDIVYASSGRPQPDPIAEPEEAKKYLHKIALRYKSYWELPEPDQRFVRGIASGSGDKLFNAMRTEALKARDK
jgi:hypothetical protein